MFTIVVLMLLSVFLDPSVGFPSDHSTATDEKGVFYGQ